MQAIFPVDFKFWCFAGRKGIYTVIRAIALARLYLNFLYYLKLTFSKSQPNKASSAEKFLLIRRPTHLSSYSNPFYSEVVENSTKIIFFDPKRQLREDEIYAPLSVKLVLRALFKCNAAILKALTARYELEFSDIKLDLRSANLEACFHFETFIYAEQLKELRSIIAEKPIFTFEQVSSYAELEKSIFAKHTLNHVQFGIIPYYPNPTIGLNSTFFIRSNKVLKEYRANFPSRNFKKIRLDKKIFVPVRYDTRRTNNLIFATQPYRKKQERHLLTSLFNAKISDDIQIKYHPREGLLYPNFPSIRDVFSVKNALVITRTSSFTVELFARGVPYACYIDERDLDLDQGEVSDINDPVAFSDLDELISAVKDTAGYLNRFIEWRNSRIGDYLDV